MNKELLGKVIDSLYEITNYADDGQVSRYDKDYKEFYNAIDNARELLEKLNKIYEEE